MTKVHLSLFLAALTSTAAVDEIPRFDFPAIALPCSVLGMGKPCEGGTCQLVADTSDSPADRLVCAKPDQTEGVCPADKACLAGPADIPENWFCCKADEQCVSLGLALGSTCKPMAAKPPTLALPPEEVIPTYEVPCSELGFEKPCAGGGTCKLAADTSGPLEKRVICAKPDQTEGICPADKYCRSGDIAAPKYYSCCKDHEQCVSAGPMLGSTCEPIAAKPPTLALPPEEVVLTYEVPCWKLGFEKPCAGGGTCKLAADTSGSLDERIICAKPDQTEGICPADKYCRTGDIDAPQYWSCCKPNERCQFLGPTLGSFCESMDGPDTVEGLETYHEGEATVAAFCEKDDL